MKSPIATVVVVMVAMMTSVVPISANETAKNPIVTCRQWDVHDLSFHVEQIPSQPVDVEFSATLRHSDGQTMQVPGFYNGDAEYVIRFTPPASGDWSYETHSTVAGLNGQKGLLTAQPPREGRRGGLNQDPNNARNFVYEDGSSYYPIAIESDWLFALDANNPNGIPDTRKFVDTLADAGFNQVVMNVFAYDVKWAKDDRLDDQYDYGSPDAFPFGGSNAEPDHSQLNTEYFQRLDRVIDYLDQKGIAAHLMIYVWNKEVNWPDADSEADNRYFDYVVRRYQAFPNLVWDISKEALGYGHNDVGYISGRIDRLRKLDAYERLVTVHDYGYCSRFPKKVDFISVQIWSSELYSVMRNVITQFPGKPILNIEHGGYEEGPYVVFTGSYTSPEVCLERAYQCVFAGTYPTHYWQGAAWNVIFPDIEAMDPATRPRLDYYRHMRTLVERFGVSHLKAGGKKSNSGFCLHNDSDLYLIYVPKENINIGVRMPKNMSGRQMKGTWFDPMTGRFSEPIKKKITQWPSFDKPDGEHFAILIVEVETEESRTGK
ncbi:DUF5060 domain-containing protein [Rhodopirellula sp. SWK7]|uniref:DUF5060 domain-containing protein n=1 Tax=Rhodopirellula sp. SWK7 TaxID=595460 RepID=UPI0002BE1581|nr:DUF5060 domain-containing protein [Rhodopirellula sp. SWK7]EMI47074.1 putative secreted protein [Rhodopirellula sp. SWK7]